MQGATNTSRQLILFLLLYTVCCRMSTIDAAPLDLTNSVNYRCLLCPRRHERQKEGLNSASFTNNDNYHNSVDAYRKTKREPESADLLGKLSTLPRRQLRDIEGLRTESMGDVLNRLFDVYDLNNDDVIDRNEFTTVFQFLH
ncbi:uncharacterized protein LOC144448586 [Glandiceps talaboti]